MIVKAHFSIAPVYSIKEALMAILEILEYPNPGLKKVSEPVEEVDLEIKTLISDMFETMYNAPGIGLAAPQVGVLKRVIVVDIEYREGEGNPVALINPEIIESSGETTFEEGCLSVPEFTAQVERFEKVTVTGLNERGEEIELQCDGLLAIAFQHEIDHLNGILFVDRIGNVKRDIFKRKFKKLIRKEKAPL